MTDYCNTFLFDVKCELIKSICYYNMVIEVEKHFLKVK